MTIQEELTLSLFHKSTFDKAQEMFKPDFVFNGFRDRRPVDLFDMNLRLYKPTESYINLELLISTEFGSFFQVVGMFDKNQKIFILQEYVESYTNFRKKGTITADALALGLKSNAVIAAYSTTTVGLVSQIFQDFNKYGWTTETTFGFTPPPGKRYDRKYVCNGLKCELIFTNNGFPQFFLDDVYKLDKPVTQYTLKEDGTLNFHPDNEYLQDLQSLKSLHLLSAFNSSW